MFKTIITTAVFLVSAHSVAQGQYIINTVAGSGAGGFNGDNIAAITAQMTPLGVCTDKNGNIYIADNGNNRVRRVSSTGIITTIAGDGTGTYAGDGGPATAASLKLPKGVCLDDTGNLYVSCDHVVRKINASTGIISTIAGTGTGGYSGDGGPATSATMRFPVGLSADHFGNLYIADQYNKVVRKVDMGTGIITTYAGTGTAGYSGDGGAATAADMNNISGLATDKAGNVYVGDNARIRKIDVTSGLISTVAGTGTPGYSGDGGHALGVTMYTPNGLAIDDSNNIYFVDQGSNTVRKVDGKTRIVTKRAGTGTAGFTGDGGPGGSAQVNLPYGVCTNAAGSIIHVVDKLNKVWKG